jgi:hypothetical protein
MNILKPLGVISIISSILIFVIEKSSSLWISTSLAKKLCDDRYLKEPDQALAQQGYLTENACGFDADMNLMAAVLLLFLVGVIFILGYYKRRSQYRR